MDRNLNYHRSSHFPDEPLRLQWAMVGPRAHCTFRAELVWGVGVPPANCFLSGSSYSIFAVAPIYLFKSLSDPVTLLFEILQCLPISLTAKAKDALVPDAHCCTHRGTRARPCAPSCPDLSSLHSAPHCLLLCTPRAAYSKVTVHLPFKPSLKMYNPVIPDHSPKPWNLTYAELGCFSKFNWSNGECPYLSGWWLPCGLCTGRDWLGVWVQSQAGGGGRVEIILRQRKQHTEPGQPRTCNARAPLVACTRLYHNCLALLSIFTEF